MNSYYEYHWSQRPFWCRTAILGTPPLIQEMESALQRITSTCWQGRQLQTNDCSHLHKQTNKNNMCLGGRKMDCLQPVQNGQTNMYRSRNSQFSYGIFPLGQSTTLCPRKPATYCHQKALSKGNSIQKIPRRR